MVDVRPYLVAGFYLDGFSPTVVGVPVVVASPPVVIIFVADGATVGQVSLNSNIVCPGHGKGRPLSAPTSIHAPVVASNASPTH